MTPWCRAVSRDFSKVGVEVTPAQGNASVKEQTTSQLGKLNLCPHIKSLETNQSARFARALAAQLGRYGT